MFRKTKQLEKRLKALEEFLGLTLDNSDPEYFEYNFTASQYNGKLRGVLGELVEAKKRRKNS